MRNHTHNRVRRYGRARANLLVMLTVALSGSLGLASPASAAPAPASQQNPSVARSRQAVDIQAMVRGSDAVTRGASLTRQFAATRPTTTTLSADRVSVRAGESVQLTGAVTYGTAARRVVAQAVSLQVRGDADTWNEVAAQNTSADGYAVFTVAPTNSSTYRLAYPGLRALAGSVSGDVTINVTAPVPAAVAASTAPTAPVTHSAAVPASGRGAEVVAAAAAQTGKPYQFAAAGPDAFDCSGLTQFAFAAVGVNLPHNADAQKNYGVAVSRANAQPGDLIIFLDGGYGYHVAIYAGGDYMYDSPNSGSTVGKRAIYSGTVIFRRLV